MLVVVATGCESGEEPVRGANKGIEPKLSWQRSPATPEREMEIPTPEPRQPQTIVVGTREQKAERDLGAELRAALGTPSDCLRDFRSSNPTTIRIHVGATVRPTGRCINSSAYGVGVSTSALDCIKRRVDDLALRPLEDTTISETASATIEFEYKPSVTIDIAPGPPEPNLRGVRDPLPTPPGLPLTGIPIQDSIGRPPEGGSATEDVQNPEARDPRGPKPLPTDGYEIDDNVEVWR